MIEILLSGTFVGRPHEVGGWAYVARHERERLAQGKGSGRPAAVTTALGAETAGACHAFEAVADDWSGDDVVVRTSSRALYGLMGRRGLGAQGDAAAWFRRLARAARRFASVQVTLVPTDKIAWLHAIVHAVLPPAARAACGCSSEECDARSLETTEGRP